MTPFLIISVLVTLLAYFSEQKFVVLARGRSGRLRRCWKRKINPYAFYGLLVILVLFVGLRDPFNDGYAYLRIFDQIESSMFSLREMDWSIGSAPGFHLCNVFIKTVISENGKVMFFLFGLFTIVPFIFVYRRWSSLLWLTIFLFASSSTLLFSMAAIKQALAMAIGCCGVSYFLRGKYYLFIALIIIGTTSHAYLPFYLSAFFLHDRLWSRKVILVVLLSVLGGVFLEQLVQLASATTKLIGKEYEESSELSGPGMNIFRFIMYTVTPIMAWKYKDEINESKDRALILFANLMLIGWCFLFIALFVSANMFGRMAAYFDPFLHLALTSLLARYVIQGYRKIAIGTCVVTYSLFLYFELYARDFRY